MQQSFKLFGVTFFKLFGVTVYIKKVDFLSLRESQPTHRRSIKLFGVTLTNEDGRVVVSNEDHQETTTELFTNSRMSAGEENEDLQNVLQEEPKLLYHFCHNDE